MLKRVDQYLFMFAVLLSASSSVLAQDFANIGTVIAIIGQPTLLRDGRQQPLVKGDVLREGDELHTSGQTSVYLRTFDQGFIAVRPNSVLLIERYRVGKQGSASQFKLQLKSGLMRSVTGQDVQKEKDKYRLNTPVAAIGLRGTDFVVFTDDHATQVAVQKGGVVIEPFSKACSVELGGPCQGINSRELFASAAHMLEVIRGQAVPVKKESSPVLQKELQKEVPKDIAKDKSKEPLKDEPKTAALGSEQTQINTSDLSNARVVANSNSVIDGSLAAKPVIKPVETSPVPVPVPPSVPVVLLPPVSPPPPPVVIEPPKPVVVLTPSIHWGRWQELANLPATAKFTDIYKDGQEAVNAGIYYVMSRDNSNARYGPELGAVNFQMVKHDGILVNTLSNAVTATIAKESSLQINFAAQSFNTHLLLNAAGRDIPINVKGTIESNGFFMNGAVSETQLRGVVSGKDAAEAGYTYYLSPASNEIMSGGTYWLRQR
ncbi:FecR domain-containing protein [Iodobacter arcticus]|uniref:FecR domain-containing protein n=1 Tax=Iodobacter arcticus TaxID=590593 RepID=A0ABW2R1W2_9NEIS